MKNSEYTLVKLASRLRELKCGKDALKPATMVKIIKEMPASLVVTEKIHSYTLHDLAEVSQQAFFPVNFFDQQIDKMEENSIYAIMYHGKVITEAHIKLQDGHVQVLKNIDYVDRLCQNERGPARKGVRKNGTK